MKQQTTHRNLIIMIKNVLIPSSLYKGGICVIFLLLICCTPFLLAQGYTTHQSLRIINPSSPSNTIILNPPSSITSYTLTLPSAVGTNGQVLTTDGSGNLSWTTGTSGWGLTGNSGTTSGTNYLGTNDAQDLMMKVNSTERLTLKQATGYLHLNQANQNTMMGYQVANSSPSGGANTGIGYQSLYNLTTGASNVALGFVSMSQNQTGSHNTALGTVALNANTGSYNVGVGSWSGYWMTGSNNVVLGYLAGFSHTSGNWNIFIGDSTTYSSSLTGSNLLNIGNSIYGTGINTSSPSIGIGVSAKASGSTLDVRGHTALTNAGTASELRFYEPSAGGSNYTAFKAQTQAADVSYTLPAADGSNGQVLSTNGSGTLSWTSASGSTALSGITAATATNTINSSNFGQTWQWNTLAGSSALTLSSTSTAAASNAQTLLTLSLSGANATSTQTSYGMQVSNIHTGTSSTNVAASLSASGGSNNYALLVPNGYVGLGTSSPLALQHNTVATGGTGLIIETASDGISYLRFVEDPSVSGGGIAFKYDGGVSNNHMEINDNSTGTNIMTLKRSAAVGIATTSVTSGATLDVKGHVALSNGGTASELRLYEPSGSGSNYSAFKSQAQSANITYTLPATDGSSGSQLQTDGSGNLSWSNTGTIKYARKTANESVTSSTTLQDDDHLTLSVGANEVWECEVFYKFNVSSNTNGGVKIQMNVPSGASILLQSQAWIGYDASTGYLGQDIITGSYAFYYTNLMRDVDGGNIIRLHGMINVSSTAGNVSLQFSQQSSNGTATTAAQNSYIRLIRIQ